MGGVISGIAHYCHCKIHQFNLVHGNRIQVRTKGERRVQKYCYFIVLNDKHDRHFAWYLFRTKDVKNAGQRIDQILAGAAIKGHRSIQFSIAF